MAVILLVLADKDEVWGCGEFSERGDARWDDVSCVCEFGMPD